MKPFNGTKNYTLPRLGVGPMSREVADILCDYTLERQQDLMIVASRNQCDISDHYSCDPGYLSDLARRSQGRLILCRDHCGPYFKDSDQGLDLDQALHRCLSTIDNDINNGFSLIHVDPSRTGTQGERCARIMIDHMLSRDPNILIEYGSEGIDDRPSSVESLEGDLRFIEPYGSNVAFVVAKTGSLVREDQVGNFDTERAGILAGMIHAHGYRMKEHNADYLDRPSLAKRWKCGIDAVNVAPQLGVVQTRTMLEICRRRDRIDAWNSFREIAVSSSHWRKWTRPGESDPDQMAIQGGHYHYLSDEARRIVDLDPESYFFMLRERIYEIIDNYHENDENSTLP